ncbi:ANK_REP_REGION domain-containing protein [Trichonephila clavata]|uniref:ANK_REP_REGION domain-containing protein n=1 Tax=Trichonephila clavata TaxID=2740835 RepID=A0A8X6LI36_TRICU|nr:ANK_REP_REGION domain-containing protein [Trichonephila clavata]
MNYTFVPSPEHKTLVEAAIKLWNEDDVRSLVSRFYFPLILSKRMSEWQKIENKVVEKVSKLPLAKPLKEKLLCFIRPVGLQILTWVDFHDNRFSFVTMLPDEFFWTPQGTIDKKKTAEALIKDESLDITKRYKLACIYCLKSDVDGLWNNIPEDQKKSFYSEKDPGDVRQQGLVILWTYDIKKEVTKLDNMIAKRWRKCTPYQYAFEYAALGGNKAATEHFLQKLTPKEREESLVRTAGYVAKKRYGSVSNRTDFPKEHYTDVLCFLLSQMNEEQQAKVFRSYPYEVLKCFLDWPWQSFFMEMAKRMWTFLPEESYDCLLRVITSKAKVVDGYKDYNYQKLFGEFWQQSPISYKRYVINECTDGSLLSNLFEVEDRENITLIVKDATLTEKEELIFSDIGEDICTRLIFRGNWNLVRFFVGECISSKEKIIELREEFKERNSRYYSKEEFAEKEDTWNKFFQLLDDLIQKDDKKRSMEEENSSPAKRLHSLTSEQLSTSKEIFKG